MRGFNHSPAPRLSRRGNQLKIAETDDFDFVELAGAQQTSSELGLYSLNRDFQSFGKVHKAFALRVNLEFFYAAALRGGGRDEFVGWRHEVFTTTCPSG
jgi:hypothetical protein